MNGGSYKKGGVFNFGCLVCYKKDFFFRFCCNSDFFFRFCCNSDFFFRFVVNFVIKMIFLRR
ncbi:hypothetical protein EWZ72_00485 [Helicobacter pylori]|nr:hypothetical protein [Helicobacter pylori]